MISKKQTAIILTVAAILCLSIYGIARWHCSNKTVLELAVFSGSNWDVETDNNYDVLDYAIKQFEEEHSDVTIKYDSGISKSDYSEYLSQRILEGDTPDIMVVLDSDFDMLINRRILTNLDSYMDGNDGLDRSAYFKAVLLNGQKNSAQYALPVESMTTLMFVNKSLLSRELVDIPTDEFTFESLYDICRRVTRDTNHDGLVDQFGICNYTWLDAAVAAGTSVFSSDGKTIQINNAEMKQAILQMQSLGALNQGQAVAQENFDDGDVAFMPLSLAQYRTYRAYPYKVTSSSSFKWGCIKMPRGPLGDNQSIVKTLNWGISAHSPHKKLAWEFLKYVSYDKTIQKKNFKEGSSLPVLKSVIDSDDSTYILEKDNSTVVSASILSDALDNGVIEPKIQGYDSALNYIGTQITQLIDTYTETTDLDYSLRSIQKSAQKMLESGLFNGA